MVPSHRAGSTDNICKNIVRYKTGSNIFKVDKFCQNVHII